ncbi:MAG: SPOR domain-containing protein [Magnetococcales bacterium]|nr:SPOR domain-containing protein [Magnetococcales bacterium]
MSLIHQLLRDFEKIRRASGQALGGVGVGEALKVPAEMVTAPGRQRLLWLAGGMALATAFAITPWIWHSHGTASPRPSAQEVRYDTSGSGKGQRERLRSAAGEGTTAASPQRGVATDEEAPLDGSPSPSLEVDPAAADRNLDTRADEVGNSFSGERSSGATDESTASSQGRNLPAPYMVQLGIFSTADEAMHFQAGLPVKVRGASRIVPVHDFLNRPMFAVRSGPFKNREAAASASGGYAAQGVNGSFVAQAVEELPLVQMDGKVGKRSEEVLPPVISSGQQASGAVATNERETPNRADGVKAFFLYTIQAGSFREGRLAEAMVAQLREKGMFPYILRLRSVDNTLWHSVCFGLFTDMEVAKQAQRQFKGGDLGKAYVLPVESRSFIKFIARRNDGTTVSASLEKDLPADSAAGDKDEAKAKTQSKARVKAKPDDKPREVAVADEAVASGPFAPATAPAPNEKPSGAQGSMAMAARPADPAAGQPPPVAADGKSTAKKSYINEKDRYAIQVGAFMEDASARELVRDLRKHGYDPYILELPTGSKSGKMRKTVRIGSFRELSDAEKSLADFRKREKRDGYVVTIDSSRSPGEGTGNGMRAVAKSATPVVGEEEGAAEESGDLETSQAVISKSRISGSKVSDSVISAAAVGETPAIGAAAGVVTASAKGQHDASEPVHHAFSAQQGGGGESKPAVSTAAKGDARVDVLEDLSDKGGKNDNDRVTLPVAASSAQTGEKPMLMAKPAEKTTQTTEGPVVQPEPDASGMEKPLPFLQKPRPLKDVIQRADRGVPGKSMQSDKFLQEAQRLEQEGDAKAAEEFARRALDLNPANNRVREFLARVLFTSGRSNEAYPLLSEGLAKGFDSGLVKLFARILVQDGKTESALGVLENARSQGGGEDEELMALLAAMYQRNKNHWKAIELYEKLLAKHTDNAIWWMGLAISLEGVDEKASALQAYQNAMENGQLKLNLKNFVGKRIQALSN